MFLQETKLGRSGRIKTPSSKNYAWCELHRTENASKGEKGGGIAIGVLNTLEPSWVSEGDDETEAITIEIWLNGFPVRLICGYGPQEYDKTSRKYGFLEYLNREVQNAATGGAGLILQMDGNLWAGKEIVMGDLKVQNQNGKMFQTFLTKNPHLSVVSAMKICEGKFTRVQNTKSGTSRTILDFFVVCDQMLPHVTQMKIDEKGEHSLTRYLNQVVQTDHNMLTLEMNLTFHTEKKHDRVEMFSFKDKHSQLTFKEYTSNTNMFSKCFLTDENIIDQFKNWQKKLKKSFHICFRKIRIIGKNKVLSKMDHLMNEKK